MTRQPVLQPPDGPGLHPVEWTRLYLRDRFLSPWALDSDEQIVAACCDATLGPHSPASACSPSPASPG
ncbi:hypothetical protein Mnod_2661 [Methylobacterium nodulans ORS 2060]|uniref:Uncharacterized protein n=1 Tax=Methylobacterium nodulans (strain LMG 21967 / CNCM I-2342 / ORS 2060) TaxID=460265 RepID=B8IE78_METNO|nr:hypothetical protein Mnod_2661 [Methylobacterium nodulans ORS 2060]